MKEFLIRVILAESKFWDLTLSSKPWRMGREGFFSHIKCILWFCSSCCLLGCFVHLAPALSWVSFFIQTCCPMLCWLSDILFHELPDYLVPIHLEGMGGEPGQSAFHPCVSTSTDDAPVPSSCPHFFSQVECFFVLQYKCFYIEYIWKVFLLVKKSEWQGHLSLAVRMHLSFYLHICWQVLSSSGRLKTYSFHLLSR